LQAICKGCILCKTKVDEVVPARKRRNLASWWMIGNRKIFLATRSNQMPFYLLESLVRL
jgi:hypothetical protein